MSKKKKYNKKCIKWSNVFDGSSFSTTDFYGCATEALVNRYEYFTFNRLVFPVWANEDYCESVCSVDDLQ